MSSTDLETEMMAALARGDMETFDRVGADLERAAEQRRARLAAPGALASAAAWYAANGVPVFPVEPRGKVPLVKWRDAATTDARQVTTWWLQHPDANIGMPTGLLWDVIDIDGPAGYQSHGLLREEGRLPPRLGRSWTPRNGMHIFIAPTGDGNATGFQPGLDYRGIGGYVVLPPSVGANGHQYEWIEAPVGAA